MSRYSAFISYSHADTPVVRWLHRALETFRVPRQLVGSETPLGPAPRRLAPVFRDRDELPASGDLGTELRAALAGASFLIVICSPRAAKSRWVDEEVLAFKRVHGDACVLALIVDGEPGDPARECFPPALRFRMGPGGVLTTEPAEPIAADIRPGGDGRRLAHLKLVAGLTGLPLDKLVRRDAARRQRRLAWIASGAVAVALLTMGLAVYANLQRAEAVRARAAAEAQRRTAEASLDFLIGTFQIANPATENPRTITAITLLNRVSDRVKVELRGQPAVSARLLRATGDIYLNLGLPKESERDLLAALAREPPKGEARALTLMQLAQVALKKGDAKTATERLAETRAAVDFALPSVAVLRASEAELRGRVAYLDVKPEEAIKAYDQALAIYSRLPGDHRTSIAKVLSRQGQALVDIKANLRADRVLSHAEQLYTVLYGVDHVLTANVVQDRALAAYDEGRLDEAESLVNRAVKTYERVLERNHPSIAPVAVLEGRILLAKHDAKSAIRYFERAVQIYLSLYGQLNSQTGDARFYLSQALSSAGEQNAALAQIALVKRAYDASYGPLDPDQAELLATRAQIERAAGRFEQARRDCWAGVALRVRLDPHDVGLAVARARCEAILADPPRMSLRFQ